MSILELNHISYSYERKGPVVLQDISYSFEKGKLYAITGRSGAGKSTLLSLISGLALPTEGKILLKGQDITSLNRYEYRSHDIGVIFQSFNLLPKLTALENVLLSMDISGCKYEDKKAHAMELLKKVDIGETEANRRILKLSGGQQQRVAIARALAAKPAILLADEPTGNLDSRTSQDVLSLLRITCQQFHQTMVMITHNEEIAQTADRILRIEDGKLVKGSDDYGIGE